MKLKEFEAKQLLEKVGIPISKGIDIRDESDVPLHDDPRLLKVQTLSGGRGKAGGIVAVESTSGTVAAVRDFLGKDFLGEKITEILLDEKIEIKQELYLGILFDTTKRVPVLVLSTEGGVDIEEVKNKNPEKIKFLDIDYLEGLQGNVLDEILPDIDYIDKNQLKVIILKLYECFTTFDCRMIEINPLAVTTEHVLVALDAVAVLDGDANYRRELSFPARTNTRKATQREIDARKIDEEDYRGVAGKTFVDLDGDIAILTSGGGASMTLMDALVAYGGQPANFTEYSGDPPKEKVEKLTRIVLNRGGLSGLLVAGVIANFTNIHETLQGVLSVLIEKKPTFPIVIRRAGPYDQEAKEALMRAKEEYGLDIHYFDEKTPLTEAVKVMVDLSEKYNKNGNIG